MIIKTGAVMIKAGIMQSFAYRASGFLLMLLNNLLYLALIYFLWKGIFNSNNIELLNGMTFNQTLLYLGLAVALQPIVETYVIWQMSADILTGQISLHIVKPISYQTYLFFLMIGENLITTLVVFLPTFVIVYFLTNSFVVLSYNILLFVISILISIIINYLVGFIVGTFCLYVQSPAGLDNMRMIVVFLLSGAIIPIAFFPELLRSVVMLLPFQAIYNAPLQFLLSSGINLNEIIHTFANQLFWVIILYGLSKIIWSISIKKITVNGG
ncbi:MAG: ABC-2 family transporter protein [Endomicrobium sp.]|jgi:ABC-2 type transport system permease protein|nr:ABC-2 family transporter protein [Endomicrobium sp.]